LFIWKLSLSWVELRGGILVHIGTKWSKTAQFGINFIKKPFILKQKHDQKRF
jgi:hypothetical protein